MRSVRVLIIMAVALALAACGSDKKNNDVSSPVPGIQASGGTSANGTGGTGGYVHLESYGGAVKVLRTGTVDASFDSTVATPGLGLGSNPYVVSGGTTTVLLDTDPADGFQHLYAKSGVSDSNLYLGNGDGDTTNDLPVTDLTVNAGATLVLVDQGYWGGYGTVWLANYLLVNGTITSAAPSIYFEAYMIDVESGGRITTSATSEGSNGGDIYLGNGNGITKTIINRGTIEAKGLGSGSGGYLYFDADDLIVNYGTIDTSGGSSATGSGGNGNEIDIYLNNANSAKFYSFGTILAKGGDSSDSNGGTGGYLYIDAPDLVVNTGTIDMSGGNSDFGSGGSGGEFDAYVGYGDFYSSGTVRMNGGKGATYGGDTESINDYWYGYSAWIETVYSDNTRGRNGDIIISGTWEANGGDGMNGSGGAGGYLYFQTDALGTVTISANMSTKGGKGTGAGVSGGNAEYGIEIYSLFDPYYSYMYNDPASPGKISIAGMYDLRGGNGDETGGNGGYFYIYSENTSGIGSDIELVGFTTFALNGGAGANGGSAALPALQLTSNSPNGMPAGPITNEANIEARGGNASATGAGGSGGTVEMITNGISDPSEIVTNSGSIDISGGTGNTGGSSNMIWLWAYHVTNSGNLTANGGNVTTGAVSGGGSGGNIYLMSDDGMTTNTGTLSVTGGTPDGGLGSVNIDTGGPT